MALSELILSHNARIAPSNKLINSSKMQVQNCTTYYFNITSFQDNPIFENILWDGSGPDSDVSNKNDTIIIDDWLKVYKIWNQGKYKLKVEMRANHSETMRGAQIIIGYEYRNSTLSGIVTILQDYIKSEEQHPGGSGEFVS